MSDTKYLDIREFRSGGYLQELNRRFLHPLGLALEVVLEPDGTERLGGVWDYRDDSEGIHFCVDPGSEMVERAEKIDQEWRDRQTARERALGFMVQPLRVG